MHIKKCCKKEKGFIKFRIFELIITWRRPCRDSDCCRLACAAGTPLYVVSLYRHPRVVPPEAHYPKASLSLFHSLHTLCKAFIRYSENVYMCGCARNSLPKLLYNTTPRTRASNLQPCIELSLSLSLSLTLSLSLFTFARCTLRVRCAKERVLYNALLAGLRAGL